MTKEYALHLLNQLMIGASVDAKPIIPQYELAQALNVAIKALEQQQDVHDTCIEDYPTCTECEHYDSEKHYCPRFCQVIKDTLAEARPCEDTEVIKVSKGAVKARQGRFVIYDVDWLKENFYTTEEKIYGQPKQSCADAVSRVAVLMEVDKYLCGVPFDEKGIDEVIKELPSVTPQRPKGKWIMNSDYPDRLICDKCNAQFDVWHWESKQMHYCPNCGAEMSGGGEDGEDSACD